MADEPKPADRTRRASAILGTAIFLFLAPGTVAGYIPWRISHWRINPPLLDFTPFRAIGILLIAAGLTILLESFARFALQGIGTPAPIFPTRHLVVQGFYRYVRNPMYVAIVATILGQALLFGSIHLLEYAAIAWLVTHLFVLTYEEPTLHKTFGPEFETYRTQVPRWIPSVTPWQSH
jgi:protein-S-isoprenylcysteine O-methyltransferase Ste14